MFCLIGSIRFIKAEGCTDDKLCLNEEFSLTD